MASRNVAFGPDYLIPKPFDPRLIVKIAPAVAKAAMDSGVAHASDRRHGGLRSSSCSSSSITPALLMKPIFQLARSVEPEKKRIVFAEGEEERVLRAVQVVVDERLAKPILVGRPAVIERRIERYGLRLVIGSGFPVVNPEDDPRYREYWEEYHKLDGSQGRQRADAPRSRCVAARR